MLCKGLGLLLLLGFQEPQSPELLVPEVPVHGSIGSSAVEVHAPALDADGGLATWGETYRILVKETGTYHVEQRSFDFDSYLILRDGDGAVVGEDNDGLIGSHARLEMELEAGQEYQLSAVALHRGMGEFVLALRQGAGEPLNPSQRSQLEHDDFSERVTHFERKEGRTSVHVWNLLSDRGLDLLRAGEYPLAEPLLLRCVQLDEEVFGKGHPDNSAAIGNLGYLYRLMGELAKAEPLLREAVAIDQEHLGPEHLTTGVSLNNLAILLTDLGRYQEAIAITERVLAIRKRHHGPRHPATATILNNLGHLHQVHGDRQGAASFFESALEIRRKSLGDEHPAVGQSWNNLGTLLAQSGEAAAAIDHYRRALSIYENSIGKDHPETASVWHNLALVQIRIGDLDLAKESIQKTLAIRSRTLGDYHPRTLLSMNALAGIERRLGRFIAAAALLQEASRKQAWLLGPLHPHSIQSQYNYGLTLAGQGRLEAALESVSRGLGNALEYLDIELPTMTESASFEFLVTLGDPETTLQLVHKRAAEEHREYFNLYLNWKGKATRMQHQRLLLRRNSEDEALQQELAELKTLTSTLSSMLYRSGKKFTDEFNSRLQDQKQRRIALERSINRRIHAQTGDLLPGAAEIQAALPEHGLALDFFVGERVYAWVVPKTGVIRLRDLGESTAIQTALNAFLDRTTERGGRTLGDTADPSVALRALIWEPFREETKGKETIILSPDGFLCRLPFAALSDADGRFLLEDHRFYYASDLTRIPGHEPGASGRQGPILALADVNYYRRGPMPAQAQTSGLPRSSLGRTWPSLSATRQELALLKDLHSIVLKWDSPFMELVGPAATEEAVRAGLPGKRYLHLATHGFFEPESLPSLAAELQRLQAPSDLDIQQRAVGQLPSLLSGLVLAGVNAASEEGRDDGFLTAEEIQNLDLSACDLAVLSACETALGSIRSGEGMMSMRRSFELSGAKTVLASLWRVDDQATASLMQDFYLNFLSQRLDKGEALYQAQLEQLRQNRADYQGDARPSTWGAFVLSGDWR